MGYRRRRDGHLIAVLPLLAAGALAVVLHGDDNADLYQFPIQLICSLKTANNSKGGQTAHFSTSFFDDW